MTTDFAIADCCSAKPAYRVVLTGSDVGAGNSELLFCAHHLRIHRAALYSQDSAVFDTADQMIGTTAVLS